MVESVPILHAVVIDHKPNATGDRHGAKRLLSSRPFWLAAALVALVFLAHGLSLGGAFIWDDLNLIAQSPLIHASDGLWRFWFTTQAPDYFPLTSTTWWIEWRIWGAHPFGYHLINLILHASSAVLIWQVLAELDLPGGWLAAAIWAVHPVQVESVAWIAERKNTLSIALAAMSMLLFLRHLRSSRSMTYVLALCAFLAALLAKTAVAPLPVVMLACAVRRGPTLRRAIVQTIPFAAMALALSAVTIYFQSQRSIANDIIRTDGLASRIAIAGRAVWFYLGKLIWPTRLAFVYPRWATGDVSPRGFVPLLLLVLTLLVLWTGKRWWGWGPLAALAYFVLMLLPMLGLLNIYFMRYSLVADHWQYAASVGPIALFAAVVSRMSREWRWAVGVLIVLSLSALSEGQAFLYRSGETLWRDTIAKNPASWMAQMNLGHTFALEGRYADAAQCYRAASALAPDMAEPFYSLATVYAEQRRYIDAIGQYERAIQLNPHMAVMYMDMGHSLAELHQNDRALACFETAIDLRPGDASQYYQLGLLLDRMNRRSEATKAYQSAVSLAPRWAQGRLALGNALLKQGERAAAAQQFEKALEIDPNLLAARVGLRAAR